jgi:DNA-binding transcriptional MerR regulator
MQVRLAIGDFSRMTHLSVKALRHYHDVGLLVPAEVDPASGYASMRRARCRPRR